jgi:hypothetical protein
MAHVKIAPNTNVKLLGKTIFSASLEEEPEPSYEAFWSAWNTESFQQPSYTSVPANGNGVNWSLDLENTTLDVTPRSALTSFVVTGNQFDLGGHVDARGCSSLTVLDLRDRTVESLNVSGLTNLEVLNVENYYSSLNLIGLSSLTSLTSFNSSYTSLGPLDLSGKINLVTLVCNGITQSLNVSGCTSLSTVYCGYGYGNFNINISGCTSLSTFSCAYNSLTEGVVNSILTTIDGFGTSDGYIDISGGSNAAPTGDGITAKDSLINRGWTVLTNE